MSDQAALLDAIREQPDEDTPRLAYADWLDEHAPDGKPSPARGPSARADYIRVQCRLAERPYDDPEYPALLELEEELARWLDAHAADTHPELPADLEWGRSFSYGGDGAYRRGFPDAVEYTDYDEEPEENIDRITTALGQAFRSATISTLRLEDAYGEEVAGVVSGPLAARLRGLSLDYFADEDEAAAVRGIVGSPHLTNLRRLDLEFDLTPDELRALAKAPNLGALEALLLGETTYAGLKALGTAGWFRNLRSLCLWMNSRDTFRALGELPPMPNLVHLALVGDVEPTAAASRRFVASDSFPRLARLELNQLRLPLDALARAPWPLRHLALEGVEVRKDGVAALVKAGFAGSLRVLELSGCRVTVGSVQALAAAPGLAGLKHLNLSGNPVGPGGLTALARGPHLRGLRLLNLNRCTPPKSPLNASTVQTFLAALDMPELRHLMLDELPVGVPGARTLAAGGFSRVTKLDLNGCGLREAGTRVLCESEGLPDVTLLDLGNNNAGKGPVKLASPKTFPRLGYCDLRGSRVAKEAHAKLRKRPGLWV
ncbi:TIGR02996 domain-containing protein [Gemmata sp. JC717]|uniref:TIGR02996 domain-containing protein n=1 Tax=Gemmata algarum TaxID=2975278 RepID=UPI0021BB1C08|nr:TIGR02996 domain-containing protein [Gemmata algarum]MDY3553582.1 TIGR02996 domain-containing protein [Gemmata algarum]